MASRRGEACCREGAAHGSCCSTCGGARCTRLRMTTLSSRSACSRRRPASPPGTFTLVPSTRGGLATCARTVPSAAMREKYFERRQIKEAIAFAEAGGICLHRNLHTHYSSTHRSLQRQEPLLHANC